MAAWRPKGRKADYVFVNSEAATVAAAMSTPPTDARKAAIDALVGTLKTAGVWTALDILYVLAAADSQAALLNWKNPATFTAVPVNSPTFVADRGFTGDGAASRVRTGFTPSTNGVNFTQNNGSIWAWSRTAGQDGANEAGSLATPRTALAFRNFSNLMVGRVNGDGTFTAASTDGSGFFGATRAVSTTIKLWRNGAQLGTDQASTSGGLNAAEQWLCGASSTSFSTRQISAGAWGAALTGLESAFYNAMLAYMQNVGAA